MILFVVMLFTAGVVSIAILVSGEPGVAMGFINVALFVLALYAVLLVVKKVFGPRHNT